MIIELTDDDLIHANEEAERRIAFAAARGLSPKYGSDHDRVKHINGAKAECAAAKEFGLPWPGKPFGVDVVFFDVRSTTYRTGHLIIHDADADERPFVLAITREREVDLKGWIYAYEGKCGEYWRADRQDGEAYFVPQSVLRPVWRLKRLIEEHAGHTPQRPAPEPTRQITRE